MRRATFFVMFLLFLVACSTVGTQKVNLELGETKNVNMGKESLNIELLKIVLLEDKQELTALIKLDGTEIWLSEGQKISNDRINILLQSLKNESIILEIENER